MTAMKRLVLKSPKSFEKELGKLEDVQILRNLDQAPEIGFVLAFVTSAEEIEHWANPIIEKAPGDAVIWFAYPKTTSKKFQVQINRDHGWEPWKNQDSSPYARSRLTRIGQL